MADKNIGKILSGLDTNRNGRLDQKELLTLLEGVAGAPASSPMDHAGRIGLRAALGALCATAEGKAIVDQFAAKATKEIRGMLEADPAKVQQEVVTRLAQQLEGLLPGTGAQVQEEMAKTLEALKAAFPNGIEVPSSDSVCQSGLPVGVRVNLGKSI